MDEGDFSDPYALDDVRIGDIDLGALARLYKLLLRITECRDKSRENGDDPEVRNAADEGMFYMLGDGPNRTEKDIALRMMMEEIFEAPRRKEIAKKVLAQKYGITDDKDKEEYEIGYAAAGYAGKCPP